MAQPKLTLHVDGKAIPIENRQEALDAISDAVTRKLHGKTGTPLAKRGNTEMFTEEETGQEDVQTVAAGQLRAFIERVERLEEEKRTIAEDIKEIFAEAKGTGFDTKAIRAIIKLRKMDHSERQEAEAIIDLYKSALGMS